MVMTSTSSMRSTSTGKPTPVFYVGFDPGSGITTLYVSPEDNLDQVWTLSAPSLVSDGNLTDLANIRGKDLEDAPASALRKGEYVLSIEEAGQTREYYVGELTKHGMNADDALGDPNRYWSSHSRLRLLALAAAAIPENQFELRVVTALPVTLYKVKENRGRVKQALQGYYRFTFNGKPKEVVVKVGAVTMEGMGALTAHGEGLGEEAIIDIGKRTVDLVAAEQRVPQPNRCQGDPNLGVGKVIDEIIRVVQQRYKRVISETLATDLLYTYAHDQMLPEVTTDDANVPPEQLHAIIKEAILKQGRAINVFIAKTWNQEGGTLASNFRKVYLVGGGAHYFAESVRKHIKKASVPSDPELANARGYLDLSLGLEEVKAMVWEL